MANCTNKCFILGNLVSDPCLRYTQNGNAVCDIRLASNKTSLKKEGEKNKAVYIDVKSWGKQAEICVEKLSKGSAVYIEGSLYNDSWTNKEGKKVTKVCVLADPFGIKFLSNLASSRLAKAILSGNLVEDPNMKKNKEGEKIGVCEFRIAVNTLVGKGETRQEKTFYVDITSFKEQAEFCEKYLKKGSFVIVDGNVEMDEWKDKEGAKKSKIYVISNNIQCPNKQTKQKEDSLENKKEENIQENEQNNSVEENNNNTADNNSTQNPDNEVPF